MKHLLLILLLSTTFLFADRKPSDAQIDEGIRLIYNLNFNEAEKHFRKIIADYPEHPSGKFFLAMVDWWRILLDVDSEDKDEIFFAKLEDVIFQCDGILKKDPKNYDALFFKGGSIGYRGRLRAIRESWLKAADDAVSAYPLVEEAYKINPNEKDIDLGFGIYNYYLSVVPEKYPIAKPFLSFFPKADKNLGITQLTNAANFGRFSKYEAQYFLLTIYFGFEYNYFEAERYANMLNQAFPENSVFLRYLGRIKYITGQSDKAIDLFTKICDGYKSRKYGYTMLYNREASYYLGAIYKIMGDNDKAWQYLMECRQLSFKVDKKGASGFLVNSSLYLGNICDQKGDRTNALKYYNELLNYKEFQNSHFLAKKYIETPFGK